MYFPNEKIKDIQNQLMDFGVDTYFVKSFVETEILIKGAKLLDTEVKVEEIWSLLLGYNEPIIPSFKNTGLLYRLRLYFPQYRNERIWMDTLERYFATDGKFRLYNRNEENQVVLHSPQVAVEREIRYNEILDLSLNRKQTDKKFAFSGSFSYLRTIDNEQFQFNGNIPKSMLKPKLLDEYREKRDLAFHLDENWEAITLEMDQKSNQQYTDRLKQMCFETIPPNNSRIFPLTDHQHIVGGLGSGKSTWMIMQSYYHVTRNQAKIGFIENSVSQVLDKVYELRSLGIHAVPIIGKGNRGKYETQFLQRKTYKDRDIDQFLDKNFERLSYLSDRCTIKALAMDVDERNTYYPCESISQQNKKFICPLAQTCGIYREWTALKEADVWVATTASVVKSKLPAAVDSYERTIYEAMYDLLDVIFVDEADAVQRQFDQEFLTETLAFGSRDSFFERILQFQHNQITGMYNDYVEDKLISTWRENLQEIDRTIWPLFEKLKGHPQLTRMLKDKLLFPSNLAYSLSKMLTKEEKQRKKIEEELKAFARRPDSNSYLYQQIKLLIEEDAKKTNIVKRIFRHFVKERQANPEALVKLEFFMYFAYMDYNLRFLLSFYPAVQSRLGKGNNFSPLLSNAEEYKPFLLEAMTGSLFSYRYEETIQNTLGQFKLVEYSGIGRRLLFDWPSLYESAFGRKGPALITLSGTSLAPGSNHFHLDKKPEWIIKSRLSKPVIMQKFTPVFNTVTGNLIKVSGQNMENKADNLAKLVKGLKQLLIHEQHHLKAEGRRILLIVNSYDDCLNVANTLEGMPELRDHFRFLAKKESINPKAYYRDYIESFKDEKDTILCVPLMAMSRAYNVLDLKGNPLFGSALFLVRPYPVPNDINYIVQILHALLPNYLKDIATSGFQYKKAIQELRRKSISRFEYMYKKPDFWSALNKQERDTLSWYLLIPIWQMIGRLIRRGKSARVYYCDGSFHNKHPNDVTLLEYWQKKLDSYKQDDVMMELYGPFITSIDQVLERGDTDERTAINRI